MGRFLAVHGDDSRSIYFAAIGDWGAAATVVHQREGQQAVADGIASWLEEISDEYEDPFIISLGDNFYPRGVKDAQEMQQAVRRIF